MKAVAPPTLAVSASLLQMLTVKGFEIEIDLD